ENGVRGCPDLRMGRATDPRRAGGIWSPGKRPQIAPDSIRDPDETSARYPSRHRGCMGYAPVTAPWGSPHVFGAVDASAPDSPRADRPPRHPSCAPVSPIIYGVG